MSKLYDRKWQMPDDPAVLKERAPFKIKSVESVRLISRTRRRAALERAGYNVFNLSSRDVYVDLLTDSGTGAMSQEQWAALMVGDEAYAGSASFDLLRHAVRDLFGFEYVLPAHQGRSAELVLMSHLVSRNSIVPGNMHFDTTSAHIVFQGGRIREFPQKRIFDLNDTSLFKGDFDLERLSVFLAKHASRVPLVVVTATCNSGGGQPVSMANIREVGRLCRKYGIPLFVDSARIMENAYFIRTYEPGYSRRSIRSILRELYSHVTGMIMSAKKDGLVNIGGLIATNDRKLYDALKQYTILFDGFPTYGGLAGRDLAAVATGLREGTDLDYLRFRVNQTAYLASELHHRGIRVMLPPGGHAVYVDGLAFCPHLRWQQYPGQALTLALYLEGGVRACEIGTILRGRDPRTGRDRFNGLDLVRLAIPRRVYSFHQLDYVVSVLERLHGKSERIRGVRIAEEPERLRHFTGRFALI